MINQTQRYAYYIGIIGFSFTPLMMVIAFLLEPTYNPFLQTLSELGTTNNGQYVFILGTVMGGLALTIFHYFYFNDLAKTDKEVHKTILFGVISGISLIGVGIIQDKPKTLFQIVHWSLALIFFIFTGLFIYYFSLFVKSKDLAKKNYYLVKSGLFPVVMILLYFFLLLISYNKAFFSVTLRLHIIWQKLTVISIIVWYFMLFYYVQKNNLLDSLLP